MSESWLESFPFPAATGSDDDRYFISLRELEIQGWYHLEDDELPGQIQHITSLQRLKISHWYYYLTRFPDWFGKLSSLQTLEVKECWELQYLPSEKQWLRLTSLKVLDITSCSLLQESCRSDHEESHKIAHFKLTKASARHSKYERMGDIQSLKSRKGKEKVQD